MPLDPPSLPRALHVDKYLPPNNSYHLILSPLGKKLKETLDVFTKMS